MQNGGFGEIVERTISGRELESHTTTNVCSDYFRTEQKKITMCKTDIRRDRNRNLDEYLDAREEYRN